LRYTRSNAALHPKPAGKGDVMGMRVVEAPVTDAHLSHGDPAVCEVGHDEVSRVLSFTLTYGGQALEGELIEARGVCEKHGDETWLIVGTTREARGEYIRSLTLLGRE